MGQVSTVVYEGHAELRKVHGGALRLSCFTVHRCHPDFPVPLSKNFDGARCGCCAKTSRKAHAPYRVNPKTQEKGLGRGGRIDYPGVHLDITEMPLYVSEKKLRRTRELARQLLLWAHRNRCLILAEALRCFCGTAFSLSLSLPLARFFTKSSAPVGSWHPSYLAFHYVLCARSARSDQSVGSRYMGCVRLSGQSLRDLK